MVTTNDSSYQHQHVYQMRSHSRRKNIHNRIQRKTQGNPLYQFPFNTKLWVKSMWEVITTSLFFLPVLAVFFAIVLGIVCALVDQALSKNGSRTPPVAWTTTTSSAQSVLSTVASATISFAGTAFSVSLLTIQLASTQYSPRIVHTMFKDPFNRRIMALVVGTFTYCLVVMRSLGDNEAENDKAVPNVSVAVAFFLGIISVLAIVAFIDHAAKSMDISQLLERITRDTIWYIQSNWELDDDPAAKDSGNESKQPPQETLEENPNYGESKLDNGDENSKIDQENPKKPKSEKGAEAEAEVSEDSHVVRFRSSGWVEEIDFESLVDLVTEGGVMHVYTVAGRYAIPGIAVCSIKPKPTYDMWSRLQSENGWKSPNEKDEEDDEEALLELYDSYVLETIVLGASRTMRSDATFGLRQLVDVTLRALSPGVNDPTTAQDAIFHATAVVTELCHRKLPESVRSNDHGGRLILNEQYDYDSIVRLAFDEVRVCASSSPTVALYLLESLRLIRESLQAAGYPRRAPEIERQARLVEEGVRNNSANIHDDHEMIVRARQDRFDTDILAERNLNDIYA